VLSLALAGCSVAPSSGEKQAGARLDLIGGTYRPAGRKPPLPVLTSESPPADYVRFAVLNHPSVEAAYDEWRASVAAIEPARALPDPQLTFQADVWSTLMSFMPGLMFDFMASGKRSAMTEEASAASGVQYRAFVTEALTTAAGARKALIELEFTDESIRLRDAAVGSLAQSLALASSDYASGRGMATLEAQMRLQNEVAKAQVDLGAARDRRTAARSRLKSALGLAPEDADPAWPLEKLAATALPGEDELWRRAQASNPELGRMRAMVEMALASAAVARDAATPDFSAGAMANLVNSQPDPRMIRPIASLTLPIWREKIAANVAAADARSEAAGARIRAEQLNMAAELAQMLDMIRESDRRIATIDTTELPNLEPILASAEAGYQTGMSDPAAIPETRLMELDLRLDRVAALREREIAATDLLLFAAMTATPGIPATAGDASP
jgi:outer membrane protein TolC